MWIFAKIHTDIRSCIQICYLPWKCVICPHIQSSCGVLPCSSGAPQVPLSQFIYIPPCAESDTIEKYVQITIVFHLLLIEGGWTIIMSIKGQLVILSTPTDPQFVHSCLIIFHSEMARAEIILAIRCLFLCMLIQQAFVWCRIEMEWYAAIFFYLCFFC